MKFTAKQLRLYAVTDCAWLAGRTLESQVQAALDGGATMVQLREKHATKEALLQHTRALAAICHRMGVPFIVDDDVEVALAAGADGVHVGQQDMAAQRARELLGSDKILGVTAHNLAEARAAQAAGADYLGIGAAFATSTKKDTTPITRAEICRITSNVTVPAVAIGGITAENIGELSGCGLAGVAVVSAIFAAEDVKAAVKKLRGKVEKL